MRFSGHKRNRTPEEGHKENTQDFQQQLENLHKEIKVLKIDIKRLKDKDEKKDHLITTILKENKILKDIAILNEKNILELKYFNDELKNNIKELKDDNEELENKNGYLERKIDKLERERDKLYAIVFSCQLRKLLKKLLEFIFNDPFLSSGLEMIGKDIHFLLLPKELSSLNFDKYDIIEALDLLLDIIQSFTSKCDYTINYVNKEARSQIELRKRINVFDSYEEFFSFFDINKNYQDILIKLIPTYLFESIDNFTFEEKFSSLISKIK